MEVAVLEARLWPLELPPPPLLPLGGFEITREYADRLPNPR